MSRQRVVATSPTGRRTASIGAKSRRPGRTEVVFSIGVKVGFLRAMQRLEGKFKFAYDCGYEDCLAELEQLDNAATPADLDPAEEA